MKSVGEAKEPVQFYDSVTGKLLFTAPVGRTMEQFLVESQKHGVSVWFETKEQKCVYRLLLLTNYSHVSFQTISIKTVVRFMRTKFWSRFALSFARKNEALNLHFSASNYRPSFRDEEVNWDYVRCLKNGECISTTGVSLFW